MKVLRWLWKALSWALVALLLVPIWIYQKAISPYTPPACRFTPTCSEYARIAIERFGAAKGGYMAFRRVLRCNPFHEGGYDPVPSVVSQEDLK